jgi:carboxypeptidase Taq
MAMLEPFFDQVRRALTPVVHEIAQCPQPDAPFLHAVYPVHEQKVFTDRVMALMGISRDDCAVGETEHPFTDGSNKHDVRITTHYHEDMVLSNLYSVIHEGGHALYELGIGDDHSGLMELPEGTVPGTDICDILPIRMENRKRYIIVGVG